MLARSRRWLLVAAVGAVGLFQSPALGAETPDPWGAHDPHRLSMEEPQALIIDEVNERIFVTTFNPKLIVVIDYRGTVVKEIPIADRETKMTLSPDGSTIWVASRGFNPVYAIDVDTLEVTEPVEACASIAIEHEGRLVTVGECGIEIRDLGDLDVVLHSVNDPDYWFLEPYAHITSGPDPVLVLVDTGLLPAPIMTLNALTLEPIAYLPHGERPNRVTTAAVHPYGTELLVGNSPLATRSYSLPDLIRGPDHGASGARGLAYLTDGSVVATTGEGVELFASGASFTTRTYHLLPDMSSYLVGLTGDNETAAVIALVDEYPDPFAAWLNLVDLRAPASPITGTISHGFGDYNDGLAPMGHADLYSDVFGYVGTVDAEPDGSYVIDEVGSGTYFIVFWNGEYGDRSDDPSVLYDFFPQLYRSQPLLGEPTPLTVASGTPVVGVDASLSPLFFDMFGHNFANDIYWLGITGITRGCNPPTNSEFCPDSVVTRGEMAAFLVRAFSLPTSSGIEFVDDDESIFEIDIERLAASGITKGCNPPISDRFCPDRPVTRGQMAAFLNRAFDLPLPGPGAFSDDDESVFEEDIERLAAAGITTGCNPPANDRFCPEQPVTRGQMAAFLNRAFAYAASTVAVAENEPTGSTEPKLVSVDVSPGTDPLVERWSLPATCCRGTRPIPPGAP